MDQETEKSERARATKKEGHKTDKTEKFVRAFCDNVIEEFLMIRSPNFSSFFSRTKKKAFEK